MKKIVFIFLLLPLVAKAQLGVTSGIATGVIIDRIKKGLNEVVDESLDRADYSVAQAAIQALGVIDAWKDANKELLNTAFDRLDATTKNMFSETASLVNQVDKKVKDNLEIARQITENANQISESIPFADKRSFILRYAPTVINPSIQDKVLIKIRGVNLDKSEPKVYLKDGSLVDMKIVGPQEINFWLPLTELNIDKNKSQTHEIIITHKTRDGNKLLIKPKYKEVKRTLLLGTLPKIVGTYKLTAVRSFEKEERRIETVNMGRFSGTNKNVFKVAQAPSGYRWDLRKGIEARKDFQIITTGGGEKGRCQVIVWNGSNEHGIKGQARCDQIRQIKNFSVRWKAGYIHCGIRGPIYRMLPTTKNITPIEGEIKWNKDLVITIPNDVTSFELKLSLYNGVDKAITNSFSNDLIQVTKEKGKVIIRSTPPQNLIK